MAATRIVLNLIAVLIVGYTLTTFTAYTLLEGGENTSLGDDKANTVHHYLKGARERKLVLAFTNISSSSIVKAAPALVPLQERTALRPKKAASYPDKPSRSTRRFPPVGTGDFTDLCPWTSDALPPKRPNCTFALHPRENNNEGIAAWITFVVMGHLVAKQGGCRIVFDYGPDINISSVLAPWPGLSPASREDQLNNWTIPPGFKCDRSANCFIQDGNPSHLTGALGGKRLADVPNYRYPYVNTNDLGFKEGAFEDLKHALRGFNLDLGMACSLGMLFHLAPSASQYEPRLFKTILPALRDESTLVISLYIRTGFTDILAVKEKIKGVAKDTIDRGHEKRRYDENIECALSLEDELLSRKVAAGYSRVVWLVISDSTAVKEMVTKEYSRQDTKAPTEAHRNRRIPRDVLYTSSHGAHTRPKRGPSTSDFASALIDWYLIGESDAVVTTGSIFSFGVTAALRTARPLYSAKARNATCSSGGGTTECVCSKHFDASALIGESNHASLSAR